MDINDAGFRSAQYATLQGKTSIRLIELGAGHANQPIVIRLITVESVCSLEYDAISYVWGDPGIKTNIICDDQPMRITVNLHWALLHVRKPDQPSIVWADAICINQQDVKERNHQVSMMGTIYANARTVYLCMGDAPDGRASDVLSILKELKPYMALGDVSGAAQLKKIWNDSRWFAIGTLTRQPWFRRAWVLQEAGLANNPRVRYGEVEFSYRDLIVVLRWFNASAWQNHYGIETFHIHLNWYDWKQLPPRFKYTFLDLLCHTTLLHCRDPRDHVYCFLGHPLAQSKETHGPIAQPDYEKDYLVLFLEVTQVLLKQEGLRVLSMVEHNESTIEDDSPSWVLRLDLADVVNGIDRVGTQFNASGSIHAPFSCEERKLVLQGTRLGTVRSSYQAVDTAEKGMTFLNTSKNWQSTMRQFLDFMSSQYGDHRVSEICRTLCAGVEVAVGDKTRLIVRLLARALEHQNIALIDKEKEYGEVMNLWDLINSYFRGHSFIVTDRQHFALGPRITRPETYAISYTEQEYLFSYDLMLLEINSGFWAKHMFTDSWKARSRPTQKSKIFPRKLLFWFEDDIL